MKLSCSKCQKILTEDLRPFKIKQVAYGMIENWDDMLDDPADDGDFTQQKMKAGIFFDYKGCTFNWTSKDNGMKGYFNVIKYKPYIGVSEKSILEGVIPPYEIGCGCCNWSMGETLTCECGNKLGEMSLDCWEFGHVDFNPKKVNRVYKK